MIARNIRQLAAARDRVAIRSPHVIHRGSLPCNESPACRSRRVTYLPARMGFRHGREILQQSVEEQLKALRSAGDRHFLRVSANQPLPGWASAICASGSRCALTAPKGGHIDMEHVHHGGLLNGRSTAAPATWKGWWSFGGLAGSHTSAARAQVFHNHLPGNQSVTFI